MNLFWVHNYIWKLEHYYMHVICTRGAFITYWKKVIVKSGASSVDYT